jgi:hypothetical protein
MEDESSREQQEMDRQGRIPGRQMSTRGGRQAGTGLVILGQGEHGDLTRNKHKRYLAIQTFTSAKTGIYHCS